MEGHGRSWKVVEGRGRSWKVVDGRGRSWKVMEGRGRSTRAQGGRQHESAADEDTHSEDRRTGGVGTAAPAAAYLLIRQLLLALDELLLDLGERLRGNDTAARQRHQCQQPGPRGPLQAQSGTAFDRSPLPRTAAARCAFDMGCLAAGLGAGLAAALGGCGRVPGLAPGFGLAPAPAPGGGGMFAFSFFAFFAASASARSRCFLRSAASLAEAACAFFLRSSSAFRLFDHLSRSSCSSFFFFASAALRSASALLARPFGPGPLGLAPAAAPGLPVAGSVAAGASAAGAPAVAFGMGGAPAGAAGGGGGGAAASSAAAAHSSSIDSGTPSGLPVTSAAARIVSTVALSAASDMAAVTLVKPSATALNMLPTTLPTLDGGAALVETSPSGFRAAGVCLAAMLRVVAPVGGGTGMPESDTVMRKACLSSPARPRRSARCADQT